MRLNKFLLTTAVVCTILLCFAITANAATDGIYTYTVSNGKATITKCDTSASGDITIPSSLGNYPVTSIGYRGFLNCTNLTSVTIPDSVTTINSSAFAGCSSLTSINVGENNNNYTSENGILFDKSKTTLIKCPIGKTDVSYSIPDNVTSIRDFAFSGCSGLTSVTIPDSIISIGSDAFYNCNGLTAVNITDLEAWCNINFSYYYNYDDHDYYKSNPLVYAKNLYLNGELATNLVIPDSVTSIKNGSFYGFSSLTSVTIPDSVTSIGEAAFYGCSSLTSVTIPDSIISIGSDAFYNCNGLTAVNITDLEAWCNIDFDCQNYGYAYSSNPLSCAKKLYLNGELVTNLVIPDSVTSIKDGSFCGCSSLTSVTIPDSVTSIGEYAFHDCTNLTNAIIPDSVTSIGRAAFYGCSSLTSVTIPDSVTYIDDNAFRGCYKLTTVNISDLEAWCNINFAYNEYSDYFYNSNPMLHAENLCLNGELITNLVIPNSLTAIKDATFYGCNYLTSITIPDSITSIGQYAFEYCSNLQNIYYYGKENDWANVSVSSTGNSNFTNLTPIYITCYNFESNGGSNVEMIKSFDGIETEPQTSFGNLTFGGWYTTPDFSSERVVFPYTDLADTTFYAKWLCTVKYVGEYTNTENIL